MIRRTLKDGRTVTARRNGGIRKRCGCARSAWTRCPHPWHANYSWQGREHRVSLHKWAKKPTDYKMLQRDAKTRSRNWVTEIEGGKAEAPKVEEPKPVLTLNAVADIYLTDYVRHPDRRDGAAKEMARQVDVLKAAFGTLP